MTSRSENWCDIVGHEGIYQISNLGNVRRIKRAKKIDATKISAAKEMLDADMDLHEIADFLECSVTSVRHIKKGEYWNGDPSFRPLVPIESPEGFRFVALCVNAKYKKIFVHRLVWHAFKGEIKPGHQITHKNGKRNDNRLVNLKEERRPKDFKPGWSGK